MICKYCGYEGGVGIRTHEKACKKRTDEERKIWLDAHSKKKTFPSKKTPTSGKLIGVTFALSRGTIQVSVPEATARRMIQEVLG